MVEIAARSVLNVHGQSHLPLVIHGLLANGWRMTAAPSSASIPRNGLLLILRTIDAEAHCRLFCYKVSGSSRGLPHERRIEITSTYQKNLDKPKEFPDVVIGVDYVNDTFVGLDPFRLAIGGQTGNASSFVYLEDLRAAEPGRILVSPHKANAFASGTEYIASFKPDRVADYLLNFRAIHSNRYSQTATSYAKTPTNPSFSILTTQPVPLPPGIPKDGSWLSVEATVLPKPPKSACSGELKALERHGSLTAIKKTLSPHQFEEIQRRQQENAELAEAFAFDYEQARLRRLGLGTYADKVLWVSKRNVAAGYDLRSFLDDGTEIYIEVKGSEADSSTFFISDNEWNFAVQQGARYWIYRVTRVRSTKPQLQELRDPAKLLGSELITRVANGWKVTVKSQAKTVEA